MDNKHWKRPDRTNKTRVDTQSKGGRKFGITTVEKGATKKKSELSHSLHCSDRPLHTHLKPKSTKNPHPVTRESNLRGTLQTTRPQPPLEETRPTNAFDPRPDATDSHSATITLAGTTKLRAELRFPVQLNRHHQLKNHLPPSSAKPRRSGGSTHHHRAIGHSSYRESKPNHRHAVQGF